jgi:hypothetical protein
MITSVVKQVASSLLVYLHSILTIHTTQIKVEVVTGELLIQEVSTLNSNSLKRAKFNHRVQIKMSAWLLTVITISIIMTMNKREK